MRHTTITSALHTGAELLKKFQGYWQFNAFQAALRPISAELDLTYQTTLSLDDVALWELDNNEALQAEHFHKPFQEMFAWLQTHLPVKQATADTHDWPFWLHTDIPGRKWQQIQAFCDHLPSQNAALEWCAGKGHLGRAFSWQHQASVTSIEFQAQLCIEGRVLATKSGVSQRFIQADIYQLPLAPSPNMPPLWMAMHACGALHVQFLQAAVAHEATAIALAPCCYHRQEGSYCPMSEAAQACALTLDQAALRLAQQNQVTAGAGERALRAKELRWRLGYEQLRQAQLNTHEYRPLPTVKMHRFSDFQAFCEFASSHHQVTLKLSDCPPFEALGEQARLTMLRLDAIRHCFRRPLELWLLLDKMAYLVQQGYGVNAHQFCAPTDTPRNLIVVANKSSLA